MFSTRCVHQCSSPHISPFCVVNDHLCVLQYTVFNPCSDSVERQWQWCWCHIVVRIFIFSLNCSLKYAINNNMGLGLESREDVPIFPSPTLHQIMHMMMWHCIVLEENGTMLQQFWLFAAKIWSYFIRQKWTIIWAINFGTMWQGMAKYEYIMAEEHDMHGFHSTLIVPCNFLSCDGACHFSRESIQELSTVKMLSKNALLSFF